MPQSVRQLPDLARPMPSHEQINKHQNHTKPHAFDRRSSRGRDEPTSTDSHTSSSSPPLSSSSTPSSSASSIVIRWLTRLLPAVPRTVPGRTRAAPPWSSPTDDPAGTTTCSCVCFARGGLKKIGGRGVRRKERSGKGGGGGGRRGTRNAKEGLVRHASSRRG